MTQLNETNVMFDPEPHCYWLDGKRLQGVTGVLERRLSPGKYDDVPEAILEAAKQRGTAVHAAVHDFDVLGMDDGSEELTGYRELVRQNGWKAIANEYSVTDYNGYASRIDVVFEDSKGEIILADIKTTYELDKAYLRWQLSTYAYMFELVNPHLRVSRLCGLWLRDKEQKLEYVDRIPSVEIARLLECDREGEPFFPATDVVKRTDDTEVPALISTTVIDEYVRMTNEVARMQERIDIIKAAALEAMKAHGVKSWKGEKMSMTYVAPKVSKRLDSKRLKEEHPDIYEKYTTETQQKESILIKIKQ